MDIINQYLPSNLILNIGSFSFSPSYFQAGAILFLVFLLFVMMAQVRRHLLDWSLKGAVFGVFLGFLLVLIFEGFLLIGGKTALTEVLGWKNAPAPLLGAIDTGRSELVNVLDLEMQTIPGSLAKEALSVESVIESLQSLPPAEVKKAKSIICTP
jgi:hypothetical protein